MPQRPPDFGSFRSDHLNSRHSSPSAASRRQRQQRRRNRQCPLPRPERFVWRSLQVDPPEARNSVSQAFSLLLAITLLGTGLPLLLPVRPEDVRTGPSPVRLTEPVVALRRALIELESDTNHRAINPHSQAIGYAQILPENLPRWSRQVFGREVSQAEFLANPDLQIRIIEYKLTRYWQEELLASGGNEAIAVRKVASRWYSGRADLYDSPKPQFYNGDRYPSIRNYTQSVLKKYRQERQN